MTWWQIAALVLGAMLLAVIGLAWLCSYALGEMFYVMINGPRKKK